MTEVPALNLVVIAFDSPDLAEAFAFLVGTCLLPALPWAPQKLSFLETLTILMISTSSSLEEEDQSTVSSSLSELEVSMVITSRLAGGFRLGPCAR